MQLFLKALFDVTSLNIAAVSEQIKVSCSN